MSLLIGRERNNFRVREKREQFSVRLEVCNLEKAREKPSKKKEEERN
jgi:hypothetical protein